MSTVRAVGKGVKLFVMAVVVMIALFGIIALTMRAGGSFDWLEGRSDVVLALIGALIGGAIAGVSGWLRKGAARLPTSYSAGMTALDAGRVAEAIQHFEKAAAHARKWLSPWSIAVCEQALGLAQQLQEQYAEAEASYRRALTAVESAAQPGAAALAQCLIDLAGICREQGHFAHADELAARARESWTTWANPESWALVPRAALVLTNVADRWRDRGLHANAEPLYKRALDLYQGVLGPDHPGQARLLRGYIETLRRAGRDEEAESLTYRLEQTIPDAPIDEDASQRIAGCVMELPRDRNAADMKPATFGDRAESTDRNGPRLPRSWSLPDDLPRAVAVRRVRWAFGVLCLVGVAAVGMMLLLQPPAELPQFDNAVCRLLPGRYELFTRIPTKEWGDVVRGTAWVPAFPVAGNPKHIRFKVASPGVTVERTAPNEEPQVRPFAGALDGWLRFDEAMGLEAANHKETESGVRYYLNVPGDKVSLIAESDHELQIVGEAIAGRSKVREAMLQLDRFASGLRDIFGSESGIFEEYEKAFAPLDSQWLNPKADIPAELNRRLEAFKKSLADSDADPKETLCLLSIVHGNALTPGQIQRASQHLGIKLAESYAALGNNTIARDMNPLGCLFLFNADLPDDFEGIVRMLAWVSRDMRGPVVTLIRERRIEIVDGYIIEREYRITYTPDRTKEVRDFLLAHYRNAGKELPPGQRLLASLESAGRGAGPFVLAKEHPFNLRYTIDMSEEKDVTSKTPEGFPSDEGRFWQRMLEKHPNLFDAVNRERIANNERPHVNDQWLAGGRFPLHEPHRGTPLVSHHLGQGPIATPVPEGTDRKFNATKLEKP